MSEEKQGIPPPKANKTTSGNVYGFFFKQITFHRQKNKMKEDICIANIFHLCFNSTGIH